MSRTFKDRPYWVRCNDPKSAGFEITHRHHLFGYTFYYDVDVYDANGDQIMVEEEFVDNHYTVRFHVDDFGRWVEDWWWKPVTKTRMVPQTVSMVKFRYPTECTAGVPAYNPADKDHGYVPCTPDVDYRGNHWRGKAACKRLWNDEGKTDIRSALIDARNSYNNGEDVDYWDDVRVFEKPHMFWD